MESKEKNTLYLPDTGAREVWVWGTHVDTIGYALGFHQNARKGFATYVPSADARLQEKKHREGNKHFCLIISATPEVFWAFRPIRSESQERMIMEWDE